MSGNPKVPESRHSSRPAPDRKTAATSAGSAGKPAAAPRPHRRRFGRGALFLIAGLLGSSALIRLGDGIGQVMALETEAQPARRAAPSEQAPAACEPDAGTAALLRSLQEREKRVLAEEAALASRRQTLALAEDEISAKLDALVAAEEKLAATLSLADTAAEADLARLTSVYENMKAREAALLFEEMKPEFAAGFLSRMRPESAAGVMAGLTPQAAYAISVVLAGRNAAVPKE